jgi:glucans biosynthesis protein C
MKNVNRTTNPLLALRVIEMPRLTLIDQSKNTYIETLRGFAIILVVFGHVIGSNSNGGMRVSDDSIFRYLYFTLEYIRMPLFTVISGWVYANKPIDVSGSGKFILGKLRRLILPMFVISTILFLLRMVIPGTNTKPTLAALPYIYVFPYDLYWYLYSLFIIFILVVLFEQFFL